MPVRQTVSLLSIIWWTQFSVICLKNTKKYMNKKTWWNFKSNFTPTPRVSTPTPTPPSRLNINSNSGGLNLNSNSNTGVDPNHDCDRLFLWLWIASMANKSTSTHVTIKPFRGDLPNWNKNLKLVWQYKLEIVDQWSKRISPPRLQKYERPVWPWPLTYWCGYGTGHIIHSWLYFCHIWI